ncbi:MAG: NIL domain-containing protein [Peptococcia bacterium]
MAPEKIVLRFSAERSEQPIIYKLIRDYGLMVNILKASINPHKEGIMVIELTGPNYDEGLDFLRQNGVTVQPLAQEIIRNEDKCTHCGACTVHCPTKALYLRRPGMEVNFSNDDCIVCLMCVKVCPVKAMEVSI